MFTFEMSHLLGVPCTIKSRSSLMALAAVKRLWCVVLKQFEMDGGCLASREEVPAVPTHAR